MLRHGKSEVLDKDLLWVCWSSRGYDQLLLLFLKQIPLESDPLSIYGCAVLAALMIVYSEWKEIRSSQQAFVQGSSVLSLSVRGVWSYDLSLSHVNVSLSSGEEESVSQFCVDSTNIYKTFQLNKLKQSCAFVLWLMTSFWLITI